MVISLITLNKFFYCSKVLQSPFYYDLSYGFDFENNHYHDMLNFILYMLFEAYLLLKLGSYNRALRNLLLSLYVKLKKIIIYEVKRKNF